MALPGGDGRGSEPGGAYYRTDVSVPIASIPAFLDAALAELAVSLPKGQPITYGHVGDGNIHLNVVPPPHWSKEERYVLFERAETLIFENMASGGRRREPFSNGSIP